MMMDDHYDGFVVCLFVWFGLFWFVCFVCLFCVVFVLFWCFVRYLFLNVTLKNYPSEVSQYCLREKRRGGVC